MITSITHKELLTFSNLTNLDWHFVDLKGELVKKKNRDKNILKDLLTSEVFVRYDADSDSYSYPYLKDKFGKDINLTEEEKQDGIAQMRQVSGIAMEYLEKLDSGKNKEDSFLNDWEVIYGADNYKVVSEYLDYFHES